MTTKLSSGETHDQARPARRAWKPRVDDDHPGPLPSGPTSPRRCWWTTLNGLVGIGFNLAAGIASTLIILAAGHFDPPV